MALVALAAGLAAPGPAGAAQPKLGVSLKYFGTRPWLDTALDAVAPSLDRVLTAIRWKNIQPTCRDIRRGRYDWRRTNEAMEEIAANRIPATITLKGGPHCSSPRGVGDQPKRRFVDEWATFARKLAKRYGPRGSYRAHPMTHLEVWSEQNLTSWSTGPRSYVRAFIKVKRAVRGGNRRVKTVVGGLGFCCAPWVYLQELYEVRGFRRAASLIGVHPYAPNPDAALDRLRLVRQVIRRNGDRAPLLITEHGWSTCPRPDLDNTGKCVKPWKQARFMLEFARRVRRADRLDIRHDTWFQAQDFSTEASASRCPGYPKHFYGFYTHAGAAKPSKDSWERLTGSNLPNNIPKNPVTRSCWWG